MMRTLSATLAFAVIAAVGFVSTVRAADEVAKEVTLKGTQQCAKCSLKEAGVTACQDVLTVKDGDKSTTYYIVKDDVSKKVAGHVCQGKKDDVSLTGTTSEKDGKTWLKVSAPASK